MTSASDLLFIAAVLCLCVLLSELLSQYTFCRHLGTAMMVIVVTAVAANSGIIPTGGTPVYTSVFDVVAPLGLFWLLLDVSLLAVLKAGPAMIRMFLLGAVGTTAGVLTGMWAVQGSHSIGQSYKALAGMFVGTYTGGSINFNAVALHYRVNEDAALYAGSMAVDSIMTTLWMIATIALPRLLAPWWPLPRRAEGPPPENLQPDTVLQDMETVSPLHLSMLLTFGLFTLWGSQILHDLLEQVGYPIPTILIVTTAALIFAQVPQINRLKGTRLLGMFAIYLFLAVIGAHCDLGALQRLGQIGPTLVWFVTIVILVHGLVTYGTGALTRTDVAVVSVASQANIGGGTTALALARTLGRHDLVLPGVLVGAVGTAIGTYLGFLTARYLL